MHNIGDLVLGKDKGLGQVVEIGKSVSGDLLMYSIYWFWGGTEYRYVACEVGYFKKVLELYKVGKKDD